MDIKDVKEKVNAGKEKVTSFIEEHEVKEKLNAGKEKVNAKIKGLAFRGMVEEKVSPETRVKYPVLDKLIPFTNYIVCGLVVLIGVMLVVNVAVSRSSLSPATSLTANSEDDFGVTQNRDNTITITGYRGTKKDVVIPRRITGLPVTSIGEEAFDQAEIISVTIPDGVTTIGDRAFMGCTSLTNVTIPNSVTTIGVSAFILCTSLTNVTIPRSVTSIGAGVFNACTSLTRITVDAKNPNYTTKDGLLYNKAKTILIASPMAGVSGSISIPAGVTTIGEMALFRCESLTNVTLPQSVTTIGVMAFMGCTSLTSITIPNNVTTIGMGAFVNCTSLTSITIPNGVTTIGEGVFVNCTSLTNVTIPNSVTTIGEGVFVNYVVPTLNLPF